MALRSVRERAFQTLSYEAGGFLIAAPLYALIAGQDASQSSLMVVAVALACMAWSPLHNTAFDWLEWRLAGRLASDRPQRWRFVHAVSHEATSILLTTPIIMLVGGHGFWHALMVDIGLTLLYSVYAYFFHIAYDLLRPMQADAVASTAQADFAEVLPALIAEPPPEPEPRPIEMKRASMRPRARQPARWAPRILPHAALALITARRDDSRVNGF